MPLKCHLITDEEHCQACVPYIMLLIHSILIIGDTFDYIYRLTNDLQADKCLLLYNDCTPTPWPCMV